MAFSYNVRGKAYGTLEDAVAEQLTAVLANMNHGVSAFGSIGIESIQTHLTGITYTGECKKLEALKKQVNSLTDENLGDLQTKAIWKNNNGLATAIQTFVRTHLAVEGLDVGAILASQRLTQAIEGWADHASKAESLGSSTPHSGPGTPVTAFGTPTDFTPNPHVDPADRVVPVATSPATPPSVPEQHHLHGGATATPVAAAAASSQAEKKKSCCTWLCCR